MLHVLGHGGDAGDRGACSGHPHNGGGAPEIGKRLPRCLPGAEPPAGDCFRPNTSILSVGWEACRSLLARAAISRGLGSGEQACGQGGTPGEPLTLQRAARRLPECPGDPAHGEAHAMDAALRRSKSRGGRGRWAGAGLVEVVATSGPRTCGTAARGVRAWLGRRLPFMSQIGNAACKCASRAGQMEASVGMCPSLALRCPPVGS